MIVTQDVIDDRNTYLRGWAFDRLSADPSEAGEVTLGELYQDYFEWTRSGGAPQHAWVPANVFRRYLSSTCGVRLVKNGYLITTRKYVLNP